MKFNSPIFCSISSSAFITSLIFYGKREDYLNKYSLYFINLLLKIFRKKNQLIRCVNGAQ